MKLADNCNVVEVNVTVNVKNSVGYRSINLKNYLDIISIR